MADKKIITKDMTLSKILELKPELQTVLEGFGIHCFSCPMCEMDTLEDASEIHDLDLDMMLEKLNQALNQE